MKLTRSIEEIRGEFPILSQKPYGRPLVYLDNGATTQKPVQVLAVMDEIYRTSNANVHRGVHFLSDLISEKYESARETVRAFINASRKEEVIFTAGATASINAVAFSFGERYVHEGDEILISEMEHHANIVPWQLLCERKKALLKVIPFSDEGLLDMASFTTLLTDRTRLVAVTHASNVLGTVNPVREIVAEAHLRGIPVLIDGAQSIQHGIVDVQELDCDFFVFSGHKIYAPTGIGVLYGKEKWLAEMPPYQGGGDMVANVTFAASWRGVRSWPERRIGSWCSPMAPRILATPTPNSWTAISARWSSASTTSASMTSPPPGACPAPVWPPGESPAAAPWPAPPPPGAAC